jgi:hypothetical protein
MSTLGVRTSFWCLVKALGPPGGDGQGCQLLCKRVLCDGKKK